MDDFTCPSVVFNAFSVLGIPTGDTQITSDLGTGVPKTRGYQITVTAELVMGETRDFRLNTYEFSLPYRCAVVLCLPCVPNNSKTI